VEVHAEPVQYQGPEPDSPGTMPVSWSENPVCPEVDPPLWYPQARLTRPGPTRLARGESSAGMLVVVSKATTRPAALARLLVATTLRRRAQHSRPWTVGGCLNAPSTLPSAPSTARCCKRLARTL